MPKTKSQKQAIVKDLKSKLTSMKSAVFVNFSGIPVKEINQLRNSGKEQQVGYVVTKKTLLKKVLSESGYEAVVKNGLAGEIATVFGLEDEIAPAKLVSAFTKSHENMKIIGGILEGAFVDRAKIMALAKLPSKQELLAKLVGSVASPLSGLLNVLQGNLRGLVCALNAIKDKKV